VLTDTLVSMFEEPSRIDGDEERGAGVQLDDVKLVFASGPLRTDPRLPCSTKSCSRPGLPNTSAPRRG
jgi:hypothetical protein